MTRRRGPPASPRAHAHRFRVRPPRRTSICLVIVAAAGLLPAVIETVAALVKAIPAPVETVGTSPPVGLTAPVVAVLVGIAPVAAAIAIPALITSVAPPILAIAAIRSAVLPGAR